jgi:hypothetical protein
MEAIRHYPLPVEVIPNLVVFGISNEKKLICVQEKLNTLGVKFRTFVEPDRDNEITALATEPVNGEVRKIFKKYQLLKLRSQHETIKL